MAPPVGVEAAHRACAPGAAGRGRYRRPRTGSPMGSVRSPPACRRSRRSTPGRPRRGRWWIRRRPPRRTDRPRRSAPIATRHSSRRVSALPMVMLLADRLASTVAPASAASRAGRHWAPRRPRRSRHARRGRRTSSAANSRSVPNGAVCPPTAISPPAMPSPDDEMPRLVELAVVRQVRPSAPRRAGGRDGSPARSCTARPAWRSGAPTSSSGSSSAEAVDDGVDRGFHRVQQRGLLQQVADRVAGDAELGEHRQRHAALVAVAAPRRRIAAAFAAGSASAQRVVQAATRAKPWR